MTLFRRILYTLLIVLTIFLSLSAIGGGISLLADLYAPPLEQLQGSIFTDWTIPGLSLLLIVGGGSLLAVILLLRRSRFALLASAAAGIAIMFFEFVEVLVIGSPAGVSRFLQILYFGTGTAIAAAAMGTWFLDLLPSEQRTSQKAASGGDLAALPLAK